MPFEHTICGIYKRILNVFQFLFYNVKCLIKYFSLKKREDVRLLMCIGLRKKLQYAFSNENQLYLFSFVDFIVNIEMVVVVFFFFSDNFH